MIPCRFSNLPEGFSGKGIGKAGKVLHDVVFRHPEERGIFSNPVRHKTVFSDPAATLPIFA
jgi:hypothetical protein